ncbi:MAG: hypothetical protein ABIP89_01565 [Polyangiaceae bacterium]
MKLSRFMPRTLAILALVAPIASAGCGGAQHPSGSAMGDMDRARTSPGAREGAELAPQTYGAAEDARKRAHAAADAGDDIAAGLYAERALAGYQHALIQARLARATVAEGEAASALSNADNEARKTTQARTAIDREGDELDKKLKIARETLAPSPSGPADPTREAARLVAARALAVQARLLCGAARLLSPTLPNLTDSEKDLAELEKKLESSPKPAPIDPAARARSACLSVLTRARRGAEKASVGQADGLLTELSATGAWAPTHDERGVVVTLRDAFKGAALTPAADTKLKELGRVLAAHPGFAVQVVLHDAAPPTAQETATDAQRAEASVKAIASGAGSADKVKAEIAGARSPIVDPSDTRHRARNARMDVVFVTPGS